MAGRRRFCHPRESGGPGDRRRQSSAAFGDLWVPAFAGTTLINEVLVAAPGAGLGGPAIVLFGEVLGNSLEGGRRDMKQARIGLIQLQDQKDCARH